MLTNEHMQMAMKDICATLFGMPATDFSIWIDTVEETDEEYVRVFAFYKNEEFYTGKFYTAAVFGDMIGLLAVFTTYAKDMEKRYPTDSLLRPVLDDFNKVIIMIQAYIRNPVFDEAYVRQLMNVSVDSFFQMLYTLVEAQRMVDNAVGKA